MKICWMLTLIKIWRFCRCWMCCVEFNCFCCVIVFSSQALSRAGQDCLKPIIVKWQFQSICCLCDHSGTSQQFSRHGWWELFSWRWLFTLPTLHTFLALSTGGVHSRNKEKITWKIRIFFQRMLITYKGNNLLLLIYLFLAPPSPPNWTRKGMK